METDPLKNKVDNEMKAEIGEQKKTKPTNMFLLLLAIVLGLMAVSVIGGFWSTKSVDGQHNMGKVVPADTAIINKSDTLKQ
jgi:hypothetical protein